MNQTKKTNGVRVTYCRNTSQRALFTEVDSRAHRKTTHAPPVNENRSEQTAAKALNRHSQANLGWNVFGIIVGLSVAGCFLLGAVVWWRLLS